MHVTTIETTHHLTDTARAYLDDVLDAMAPADNLTPEERMDFVVLMSAIGMLAMAKTICFKVCDQDTAIKVKHLIGLRVPLLNHDRTEDVLDAVIKVMDRACQHDLDDKGFTSDDLIKLLNAIAAEATCRLAMAMSNAA